MEQVACNPCGANDARERMIVDDFTIVECNRCSLVYVNPRLRDGILHEIYDEAYYSNPAFQGSTTSLYGYGEYLEEEKHIRATFKRRLDTLERLVRPGTLLDVGCAMGFFLDLARERGWKVHGLELSEFAFRYATQEIGLPVRHVALEAAEIESHSLDAVALFDVIEHLPDPKKTVRTVHRILKPGGVFAVTTPDIGSPMARLLGRNWEEVRRVREHIYFFSRKTLAKMLHDEGFDILRMETAGRHFPIKAVLQRGKALSAPLFGMLEKVSLALGLQDRMVYIDPRYKVTVYASKRVP